MLRRRAPPLTRSAEMVKEYLDIINLKQAQQGKARRFDIYRRAGSEAQTDRMIKHLKSWRLIDGDDENGYTKTPKGEKMHEILCKHADLAGIFTQQLKGQKVGRW